MTWTTPDIVRRYLNLTSAQLPDSVINPFIVDAQFAVRRDLGTPIQDEELIGITDTKFKVARAIGDSNFDRVLDKSDVTVYGWTDSQDENTKTQLTVDKISPYLGYIWLTSKPVGYQKLTADYFATFYRMDFDLIEQATTLYASYLYLEREYRFSPIDLKLGTLRIGFRLRREAVLPATRAFYEYQKVMNRIREHPVHVVPLEGHPMW